MSEPIGEQPSVSAKPLTELQIRHISPFLKEAAEALDFTTIETEDENQPVLQPLSPLHQAVNAERSIFLNLSGYEHRNKIHNVFNRPGEDIRRLFQTTYQQMKILPIEYQTKLAERPSNRQSTSTLLQLPENNLIFLLAQLNILKHADASYLSSEAVLTPLVKELGVVIHKKPEAHGGISLTINLEACKPYAADRLVGLVKLNTSSIATKFLLDANRAVTKHNNYENWTYEDTSKLFDHVGRSLLTPSVASIDWKDTLKNLP